MHKEMLKKLTAEIKLDTDRVSVGTFDLPTLTFEEKWGRLKEMPRRRNIVPFYLVIKDEDNYIFNVIGPIESDFDWNQKITELQKTGRNIRCFMHPGSDSRESIIQMMSRSSEYRFSKQLIVEEPEDRSAEFAGPLPDYARNAHRRRVVRALCKGKCRMTRWIEMEVDFPGDEVLKNSQVSDYEAKCLKCGYLLRDPYNWYR